MAKQKYKDIRFQKKTLQLIDLINDVAEEYQNKGLIEGGLHEHKTNTPQNNA